MSIVRASIFSCLVAFAFIAPGARAAESDPTAGDPTTTTDDEDAVVAGGGACTGGGAEGLAPLLFAIAGTIIRRRAA